MYETTKTKDVHPLKVVRLLLGKSRAKFGRLLGKSESYVEAIEYRQRRLTDEMADEISLRYGIDSESLKRGRGFPRSLIDTKKIGISYGDPDYQTDDLDRDLDDPAGRAARQRAVDRSLELVKELNALLKSQDKYDRLQRSMRFWQKYVLNWKHNHQFVENVLRTKLRLLVEAAKREDNYYFVTMRLSRFIEDVIEEFRLRGAIKILCYSRTEDKPKWPAITDSEWPSFMDSLASSFWVKRPRRRKR